MCCTKTRVLGNLPINFVTNIILRNLPCPQSIFFAIKRPCTASHGTWKVMFQELSNRYISKTKDFIKISDPTYRKLEIGKVVTQPVKIIQTHLRPKFSDVSMEKRNGEVTKKGEQVWGKIEGV